MPKRAPDIDQPPEFLPLGYQPPKRRGGRRPGAGAPRGNLNAVKSGWYSKRFQVAAMMLCAVPELRLTLITLLKHHDEAERKRILHTLMRAHDIAARDPEFAETIKAAARESLLRTMQRNAEDPHFADKISRTILQSNRR